MSNLDEIFLRLQRTPGLSKNINIEQLNSFLRLASRLLPFIRADDVNKGKILPKHITLPASIVEFLAAALTLEESIVKLCWAGFGDLAHEHRVLPSEDDVFQSLGPALGITIETLEPPTVCTTDICANAPLTKRQEYSATLFTLHRGVLPITVASMYCQHCHTTYHHNYKVRHAAQPEAQREYYGDVPDRILVSMHHVVERDLAVFWETQMVFSHTSAEAASRIYNIALRGTHVADSDKTLTPDTIWDAFFLHALLRDVSKRGGYVSVPHHGVNSDRLNDALRARNMKMAGPGQAQWAHACRICQKVVGTNRISACVTDGLTMGHACCGVHNCQIPLANQKAWFCPTHADLRFVCAVDGCNEKSEPGWRTCKAAAHRQHEVNRRSQGKAIFMLRARQARNEGRAEPSVPSSDLDYLDHGPPEDEEEEGDNITTSAQPKIRGRLSRRWTHNEQLLVRCCGIIVSRATFFGAEAISSVKDFILVTFPAHYPGSLPSYIFYDNACLLLRHLLASADLRDARLVLVGFPVDVFHASRKHKDSDAFCVANCSPVTFPEIMAGNDWIFNSSAAEQTNNWFGKFQPIVKEMAVLRYNFFLDEMISLRNEWKAERLRVEHEQPHLIPLEDLETRFYS